MTVDNMAGELLAVASSNLNDAVANLTKARDAFSDLGALPPPLWEDPVDVDEDIELPPPPPAFQDMASTPFNWGDLESLTAREELFGP